MIRTARGTLVSFDRQGSGPPLVLVHGAFSDHVTNWEFVMPMLTGAFTVFAIARRGRGETDRTAGHRVEGEADDVAAVIEAAGEPVYLLGHSYGAVVALLAAAQNPEGIRKQVLYEPPRPDIVGKPTLASLEAYARYGDWDGFSWWFFRNVIQVPSEELTALRKSTLWRPIVTDAAASLGDLRALSRFDFRAESFSQLHVPTLLQCGSESRRDLYLTDALAAVLPDVQIDRLDGQAHEGMTTAPEQYVASVLRFAGTRLPLAAGR